MLGVVAALIFGIPQEGAKPAPEELRPGLVGEYFYLGERLTDFPALEPGARPRFKRVDRQIDFLRTYDAFGGTLLRDYFFVRWTGILRIPKAGKIRLFTVSDDGSRLFVGGKLVVDNGGVHEMREKAGEIELATGDHDLRVEYFDSFGHAGVRIEWEAEGLPRDVIPASALWHRKEAEPTEDERKGIRLPVEERRPEKARADPARKDPAPEKKEEPSAGEVPLDEKVVGKDGPPPAVWGRVVNVFQDGATTLLTIRRGGTDSAVFLHADAKVVYVGFEKPPARPSVGLAAYVWLKPGSADTASAARFAR